MASDTEPTWITVADVKDHLSIDESITTWDKRIQSLIGAAIDWAENFTNRSLGELLTLDSPRDSTAVPLPNPVDSPPCNGFYNNNGNWAYWDGEEYVDPSLWEPSQWRAFWVANPVQQDQSAPLRRDVREAILLYIETLFDRNPENFLLLERRATDMLWPYRIALGV